MRRRFFSKFPNNIVNNYLTIEALEDNLSVKLSKNACEYCINGDGNWINIPANTETTTINKGQTLSFRGHLVGNSTDGIGTFSINKKCNIKGNCMSMLFGDDILNSNQLLNQPYAFLKLFYGGTNIISVDLDILPAVTLTGSNYCYQQMFAGCTSLVNAPNLPSIKPSTGCCYEMFDGCSSLVDAPKSLEGSTSKCYFRMFRYCTSLVNAPKLSDSACLDGDNCYDRMFAGCTSLVNAPELPATTITSSCYLQMFWGCTSLTKAPELPAKIAKTMCYQQMFAGCTSLVNAPALPAHTLATSCYQSMFQGCTSLVNSPELPAMKLVSSCYAYMFDNCPKLKVITMLATSYVANALTSWTQGVASNGTFIKDSGMGSLPRGSSGIPSGWTVVSV